MDVTRSQDTFQFGDNLFNYTDVQNNHQTPERNPRNLDSLPFDPHLKNLLHVGFDPTEVSYQDLVNVFWSIHNPITRNRQGQDIGAQYLIRDIT
jgi:hypothetical protein